MSKVIFKKEYDGESLCDVERDMSEAFDPRFNIDVQDIPVDEYGFSQGTFKVTIEWCDNGQFDFNSGSSRIG